MNMQRMPIALQIAGMFFVVTALMLLILGYTLYYFKQAGADAENIVSKTAPQVVR